MKDDINITKMIKKNYNDIKKIRREFHQCPEIGMQNIETSKKINKYLKKWGYETQTGIGETGLIGILWGDNSCNKTIAIRADMDALPIKENTNLDYSSKKEGIMHACGHDGHIAIALGAAKILSKFNFDGNIKFIFQPGEEIMMGAKAMLKEGVLKNPAPNFILGLHIMPLLESGMVGIKEGPILAAMDKFKIKIKGKGGHGATPEQTIDPIMVSSEIITASQKLISREVDSLESAVISFGKVNSGTSFNIIPEVVNIEGNIRTFNSDIRDNLLERFEEMVKYICMAFKCDYEFILDKSIPATVNDPEYTKKVEELLEKTIGKEKIIKINEIKVSEDFSLYAQKIPGVYLILGTKNEDKGIIYPLHHPKFTIDEEILSLGVKIYCELILNFLKIL